jgi:hypothetical protein
LLGHIYSHPIQIFSFVSYVIYKLEINLKIGEKQIPSQLTKNQKISYPPLNNNKAAQDSTMKEVPILLVANKIDLRNEPGALENASSFISRKEGENLAEVSRNFTH